MTNLELMLKGLSGFVFNVPKEEAVDKIPEEILKMIACPFEAVEDPDALEIPGCPSMTQCMACKRQWLKKPVGQK